MPRGFVHGLPTAPPPGRRVHEPVTTESGPTPRRSRGGSVGERLAALTRNDKWYLGGLDGVVWAPPFPAWLDRPGFWDPAHLLNVAVGPGFSVALLDGDGAEVVLRRGGGGVGAAGWEWRPGRLRVRWEARPASLAGEWRGDGAGAEVVETRRVLAEGVLQSSWSFAGRAEAGSSGVTAAQPGTSPGDLLVAFTAQPAGDLSGLRLPGRPAGDRGVSWIRSVTDHEGKLLPVRMAISGTADPVWCRVVSSEGSAFPWWRDSPFAEAPGAAGSLPPPSGPPIPGAGLPSGSRLERADTEAPGWIWIAAAFPVPPAGAGPAALRMQIEPVLADAERPRSAAATPIGWESFFDGFPSFHCGDPHLDRYFDYRIHGLGLNRIAGPRGNVQRPCIAEGPAYFHVPITYSAQCHMMEMRWRAGGREAWGSLLNFLDNQKEDGSLHGRLYPHHLENTDFYHANWGDALLAVSRMHPDGGALRRCYEGLSRYARWLNAARDPEGSGMFTVVNHFETGQEYMSRYMAVDDEADVSGWSPRLRLKGIDVTVYAHQLFRALAEIAGRLGLKEDAEEWRVAQDCCACAIIRHMWCPDAQLFTDVDGRTGRRTGVKAAVGFYPLLTGLVDGARLEAVLDHLEDPRTFGTPFPLPSSSVDDPRFSAEGIWRGKRRNCPWNGRVWPMTTSHVIEGLLRCRRAGSERAGRLAADMLLRFVRMMFTGGDAARPNCFEHYNPYTGRACHFRGIDDYQHSWVLDLLARGVAGLEVDGEGLEVWPLDHGLAHVSMGPVRTRGHRVEVVLAESRVSLAVDGKRYDGVRGRPLRVGWAEVGGGSGRGAGS